MKIGDQIPPFSLPDHTGKLVSIQDYLGKKHVVLFFYPKDNTPGWRIQVCEFRDMYQDFVDNNAVVLGISSDSQHSHMCFVREHNLPYPLLVDEDSQLRNTLQVPKSLFFLPGRVTYVIDKTGIIRFIFNSASKVKQHVSEALSILSQLEG